MPSTLSASRESACDYYATAALLCNVCWCCWQGVKLGRDRYQPRVAVEFGISVVGCHAILCISCHVPPCRSRHLVHVHGCIHAHHAFQCHGYGSEKRLYRSWPLHVCESCKASTTPPPSHMDVIAVGTVMIHGLGKTPHPEPHRLQELC